jgi:HMGL-like
MSRERLYLFDTTLRDGAQTNGVDFTLQDKQVIAGMLDALGIDYVEGGYPGANPTDTEFFSRKPAFDHARFTAFGMTRRPRTIRGSPASSRPRRTRSASSQNPPPTRSGLRSRPPMRRISPRSATASRPPRRSAAR